MKIMVVGGGGREHAIIKKLKENKEITEIFALPGNGGMAEDATLVSIGAKEIDKIVETAFLDREELCGFEYLGIKMPDNSMVMEAIKEGASVIIRKDAVICDGDIIAAVHNENDAVIRIYHKSGNTVLLKAAGNSELYPDIEVDLEKDRFIIIGKVVHCTNYFGKNK